ncbi:MAG TPA: hypothetical protein VMW41_02305 [Candidatus Bathyarchaeia archaeon]|nr:hypothetical protein [Candidatus Bathyarchaeia archaeon]
MVELTAGDNLSESGDFSRKKTAYCQHFALSHKDVFRIHQEAGLLGLKKRGSREFRNVAEHCLVAGIFADILCELAGMGQTERNRVVKAAILHDWNKRDEVNKLSRILIDKSKMKGYARLSLRDIEEIKTTQAEFLRGNGVEAEIIRLSQANIPETDEGPQTLTEKIVWFVDAMLYDTEPVAVSQRMSQSQKPTWDYTENIRIARNQRISEAYRARYRGRSLLEVQQALAPKVSADIAEAVGYQGEPAFLPEFLREQFVQRVMGFSDEAKAEG